MSAEIKLRTIMYILLCFIFINSLIFILKIEHAKKVCLLQSQNHDFSDHYLFNEHRVPSQSPVPTSVELCNNGTTLLAIVPSRVQQFALREAIRNTFGRCFQWRVSPMKMIFYLSQVPNMKESDVKQLQEEKTDYNDIYVDDTPLEDYKNYTKKTLHAFQWAQKHCPSAKYFIKHDDDVFIFIDRLVKTLKEHATNFRMHLPTHKRYAASSHLNDALYLWGHTHYNRRPIRDLKSRFYVSKAEYPADSYPTYTSGHAFVFSRSLLDAILKKYAEHIGAAEEKAVSVLSVTDTFVTGVLLKDVADVERNDDDRFCPTGCTPDEHTLVVHYATYDQKKFWSIFNFSTDCHGLFETLWSL